MFPLPNSAPASFAPNPIHGLVRCLVIPRLLDFVQTKEDALLDRDGLGAASTRPVAPAMVSKQLYRMSGTYSRLWRVLRNVDASRVTIGFISSYKGQSWQGAAPWSRMDPYLEVKLRSVALTKRLSLWGTSSSPRLGFFLRTATRTRIIFEE